MGTGSRWIVNDFVAAKATGAERAIAYEAINARTSRRLCGYGATVDNGVGPYCLDAGKLGAFRGTVRRRATMITATSGVVVSAVAAVTVFALAK